MLATTLAADPFLGRLLTGRIEQGTVRTGQTVHALDREGRESSASASTASSPSAA